MRAALGPVSMEFYETWDSRSIRRNSDGLFYQKVKERKPATYHWGLLIAIRPDELARIFNTRFGTAFEQSQLGAIWWNDTEAAPVSPELTIEVDFDGDVILSELHCDHYVSKDGNMELPDAMELFGTPELGVLPLKDGDRLMKGLLKCTPEFFDLLKAEKQAFGAVPISSKPGSAKRRWASETVESRVKFPSLLHAWGLEFTAYFQRLERSAGKQTISSGFETAEEKSRLEDAIERRTGAEDMEGQGWMLNLPLEDIGYTPSQNFAIRGADNSGERLLFCSVDLKAFAAFLPEPSDLFFSEER
jgi:hypothetical protein